MDENELKKLIENAEKGDPIAQKTIGNCYSNGEGVEQDYEKAVYWYTKAAEQGNADAQFILAYCYYDGEGIEQDYEKAVFWFTEAAEQGDADAQNNLALCYENGEGVEQDYKKAVFWFTKAAEQGNADAQINLALCYKNGNGVEQDYKKAVYWFTKAAEQGLADAQINLAFCYEDGEGVEQNYEKAVFWYTKAAEQEDAFAQSCLADCYYDGKGVEQNYEKAVYWYTKAAEKEDAHAQLNLAGCYMFGDGVEQDYKKHAFWLTKVAEQGNAFAQYQLAESYYYGEGVARNYQKAFELYEQSCNQKYYPAYVKLAKFYLNGEIVERDVSKAIDLLTTAAESKECAEAYLELGKLFYEDIDIQKNYGKALKYFLSAIEGDNTIGDAYYFVADIYHNGLGCSQDLNKAQEYYLKAKENGYCCDYAIEMIKDDIKKQEFYGWELAKLPLDLEDREYKARKKAIDAYEEENSKSGIRHYMEELMQPTYTNPQRMDKIAKDLQEDFGIIWAGLKANAQKSLITGLFIFSSYLSMGSEYYENLDFSPIINQLSKAYEIELKKFFFSGFIRYLKRRNVSYNEFVVKNSIHQHPVIKELSDKTGQLIGYNYQPEDSGSFSLGSIKYLIAPTTIQQSELSKPEISFEPCTVNNSLIRVRMKDKNRYIPQYSRKIMDNSKSCKTVNKYILEYTDTIFKEDAFSIDNRQKDIVNYLTDLANDTETIRGYRNNGTHEKTMTKDEAASTADYLVMIHKVIYKFLSKIKPELLADNSK